MYQYYGFGLMMAQWAETSRRIFNIDYQYILCHWRNNHYIMAKHNGMAAIKEWIKPKQKKKFKDPN